MPFFVDMHLIEEWKLVPDYNDYEISNLGRVRSYKGRSVKLMKTYFHCKGYLLVGLSRNSKQDLLLVHRLVAQLFVENPYNKNQVNHIDGNKMNNAFNNLEWCTLDENISHAIENKSMGVKLSKSDVKAIRLLLKHNIYSRQEIADLYNITTSYISGLINMTTWKNVV